MLCHKCKIKYIIKNGYLLCANKKCPLYNKKQTQIFKPEEE